MTAVKRGFLLVEGRADDARVFARVLGAYRPVRTASSVAEARDAMAVDRAWCGLVVGASLDDGSGLDVLAAVRARDADVAAVVVGAVLERDLVNRAFLLDAAFLCKPLGAVELRTFASRALAIAALPVRDAAERVWRVARLHRLSPRETELLAHGVARRSRQEILAAMGISDNTLKGVVRSLLMKLDAANLDDAALGVLCGRLGPCLIVGEPGDGEAHARASSA